jgi:thioredoxin 1
MEVRCKNCGALNRFPDNTAGKSVVCGKCKQPLAVPAPSGAGSVAGEGDGHPLTLTDASFAGAVKSGPVVVDFWAPWCGPCRMIGPVIEQLAKERRDLKFGKLNVDENPRTASSFNARSIPLLVFLKDGAEKGRVVGAVPRGQIEAAIRQYLS